MSIRSACAWIAERPLREKTISTFSHPLTAAQLAQREGINLDHAGYLFWELGTRHLVECLNHSARKSRLYWLTTLGQRCRDRLRCQLRLPPLEGDIPKLDWDLYGWLCFRHRSAIMRALTQPLQPAAIKRQARRQDESLRMSANNVRDIIKLFLKRGIVHAVPVPREHHPRYALTTTGEAMRRMLIAAGARE